MNYYLTVYWELHEWKKTIWGWFTIFMLLIIRILRYRRDDVYEMILNTILKLFLSIII